MSTDNPTLAPGGGLRQSIRRLSVFQLCCLLVGTLFGLLALATLLVPTVGQLFKAIPAVGRIPRFSKLVVDTAVVVVGSSAVAMVVGAVLAWLNERTDARIGVITDSLPLIPFLLPPVAGAIGWVLLLSPQSGYLNHLLRMGLGAIGVENVTGPLNIYSIPGMIFVYVLYQVPYAFMLVSGSLRTADASLDEQSRISGAALLKTVRYVTLPATKQSLVSAWLMMMLTGFSLFSVPLILGSGRGIDILAVRIVDLLTQRYPPETAAAIGLSLILVLFVGMTWIWQVRVLRSNRFGMISGKGQRFRRIRLGKWRPLGMAMLLGYGFCAVVLPAASLLLVSLYGFWNVNIDWSALTVSKIVDSVFNTRLTMRSLQNGLFVSALGATVGIAIATLVSMFVNGRGLSRLRTWVDGMVKLPSVFPNLVIAIGFILVFSREPFNLGGTVVILLMAYITIYMPQGAVSVDSALSQVGRELAEASSIAGASDFGTFRRVHLPLIFPGIVAGWAFLFARMLGDLTATALLAGPRNPVIGSRILQIFTNGSFADLASLSLVMTVMSSTVVVVLIGVSRRYGQAWLAESPKRREKGGA